MCGHVCVHVENHVSASSWWFLGSNIAAFLNMWSISVLKGGLFASSLQLEVNCVVFCTSMTSELNLLSGRSLCSQSISFILKDINHFVVLNIRTMGIWRPPLFTVPMKGLSAGKGILPGIPIFARPHNPGLIN